jgi:hypothetical protein
MPNKTPVRTAVIKTKGSDHITKSGVIFFIDGGKDSKMEGLKSSIKPSPNL